jgi:hypothetical protein
MGLAPDVKRAGAISTADDPSQVRHGRWETRKSRRDGTAQSPPPGHKSASRTQRAAAEQKWQDVKITARHAPKAG